MARICSVIVHHVRPKSLDLVSVDCDDHKEYQLRIGGECTLFTDNHSLDEIEALAKHLLKLTMIARGREVLAAESVLTDEPGTEDVPITADLPRVVG